MKEYKTTQKKNAIKISLAEIVKVIQGKLINGKPESIQICGIGTPDQADSQSIIFAQNKPNLEKAIKQHPIAIVAPEKLLQDIHCDCALVVVDDLKLAQLKTLALFDPRRNKKSLGIHPKAMIAEDAIIGDEVTIMEGAVIQDGAIIGDNVIIYPNVTVEYDAIIGDNSILYPGVVIGERCIIGHENILYAGVVIGTDGYGYYDNAQGRHKIPQIGIVRTSDRVEIGANVCIDRATIGETLIGADTKFDNLVQIGHNCQIGDKCYIVSQVGVSGSTNIGNQVILGGQVGVADHCNIGDGVIVLSQSGIPNDLKPGERVFGTPARPVKESHRINGALPRLPELLKRVSQIEKQLNIKSADN